MVGLYSSTWGAEGVPRRSAPPDVGVAGAAGTFEVPPRQDASTTPKGQVPALSMALVSAPSSALQWLYLAVHGCKTYLNLNLK
jgi:hypothetical protein